MVLILDCNDFKRQATDPEGSEFCICAACADDTS
jgi:hypothetical protein